MALWVIGDVQGCADALWRLLQAIAFTPGRDRLWFAGDLVNRGPDSLGVLRWTLRMHREHPGTVATVLGNHDLHLLCRAAGLVAAKRRDTLDELLSASDLPELCAWLSQQPLATLLQPESAEPWLLVHAGLLPQWSPAFVLREAESVCGLLNGPERLDLLAALIEPRRPTPMKIRLAADFAAQITRLRCLDERGEPCGEFTDAPEFAPVGYTPWFAVAGRKSQGTRVIFGHWAALGVRSGADWLSLDSGCVWGQRLTAVRLPDGHRVDVPAQL